MQHDQIITKAGQIDASLKTECLDSPDIRQSDTSFRPLFDNHSALMLLYDAENGTILDANQAAANFYGWTREELCRKKMQEIAVPPATMTTADPTAVKAAEKNRYSARHKRADGSTRDVEVFSSMMEIQGNAIYHLIIQDISERKQFDALTEFRIRLIEMAETSSTEDLLTFTLDEAERLTGSSVGFFNFISDDQTLVLRNACSSCSKTDNCGHAIHPTVIKSGICKDVLINQKSVIHNDYSTLRHCNIELVDHKEAGRELIVPIIRNGRIMATLEIGNKPFDYDEDDKRLATILAGVAWDIIAKKYAEESEKKMQEVVQYTQKMELIGQLAGGVAHDINNVLTSILGHAELVLDDINQAGPHNYSLQNIRSSAIRAANLIDQLLAFARKQTIQPKILELDTAIGDLYPVLRKLAGEHASFEWHPDSNHAKVLIDPTQLDQIITNLFINASEAVIASGTITIDTAIDKVERSDCYAGHTCQTPGEYVRISVVDTGTGIDKSILPHIFEPFFTTKEFGKGTGMGLSTVYGIVKQNNGYIDCWSIAGKGSGFIIFLPRVKDEADPAGELLTDNTGLNN